jgi:flagellar protein FliS
MQRVPDPTLAYRQTAAEGTTLLGVIVSLYDRAIEDMRRAVTAMREQRIEQRTESINHALLILQQLQGTLDFAKGGEAAHQLDRFYSLVRAKLLEAQIGQSTKIMQQQIALMLEIRECWAQAELNELNAHCMIVPVPSSPITAEEGGATLEWRA